KCRAPICWDQVGERVIEGPEMIEVTNKHRRLIEFPPGDRVFLKVSPARGVRRFGIKGKLSPRFIEPFDILDRVEGTSIILFMSFHIRSIRSVWIYLTSRNPEAILDRQDRVMRNKTILFVKILWRNHSEREATWETEESIRTSYPHFLS
nr:hypothetical protein [Tanacetum cinerariifolium]